jgi:hypothetical protein
MQGREKALQLFGRDPVTVGLVDADSVYGF